MKHLAIFFVMLFAASFGLYWVYLQMLAAALGIEQKTITAADFIEGGCIALLVSSAIGLVLFLIWKALKKNQG